MFEFTIRTLPPESVAMFRWRGPATDAAMVSADPWYTLTSAVHAAGGKAEATVGVGNVYEVDGLADLDLGFVTEELLPPGDGYVSRVLDGGEFASTTFDRFADKAAAYEALWSWVVSSGRAPRGPIRERGPLFSGMEMVATKGAVVVEPDPTGWRTEILLPV